MTEVPTPAAELGARACGACDLCCTVLKIEELNKPLNVRCAHQNGRGCAIWGVHPVVCQVYLCLWRLSERLLPPEMFPLDCGFVLSVNPVDVWPAVISVRVAPEAADPMAWSRPAHFDRLKRLAAEWNASVAVVDGEGRANQVFTPMGRFYARRTRPDLFGEDGRQLSLPEGEFGPDRRPPRQRF